MRLILIMEDEAGQLEIGKPKVSVVELKGKNAVIVDVPATPKKSVLKIGNLENFILNTRQENFLNSLAKKTVTNFEYRRFFKDKISTESARGDLTGLVKKGIMSKKGSRKGTVYFVRENLFEK